MSEFKWYESTHNRHVARFGEHGTIEVVRSPKFRTPRLWHVVIFGSHVRTDNFVLVDDAKRAAERECLREIVRLAVHFRINGRRLIDGSASGGDDHGDAACQSKTST